MPLMAEILEKSELDRHGVEVQSDVKCCGPILQDMVFGRSEQSVLLKLKTKNTKETFYFDVYEKVHL